jgi:enterochelin esterase-like enzyme
VNPANQRISRRKFLSVGIGGVVIVAAAGTAGVELVSHNVLPGKQILNQLDGSCSVTSAPFAFSALGLSRSGYFYSKARRVDVGYTIALPPGHEWGSRLPLIVMLHGYGANHTNALSGLSPAQAVALRVNGKALPSMAMVTVDGGGGYWNPHPGDNPMKMVIEELIPMCQKLGLGQSPQQIGTMGISMGGYGALLLAEKYSQIISAVAAISPAIWTSYSEARSANPGAFASAEDFANDDVIMHAGALSNTPVRVASGQDDPFFPGVQDLVTKLPPNALTELSRGCHSGPFFRAQEPASLAFLGSHLVR